MTTKDLIQQGMGIIQVQDFKKAKADYKIWCEEIRKMAAECQLTNEVFQELCIKMHFIENEFSIADSMANLKRAVEDTSCALERADVKYCFRFSLVQEQRSMVITAIVGLARIFT